MDKYIGKTLNDRYMLTEVIGVGGMAEVYKAFDKLVNRVVAVKILKEEFMSDAQFRRRFSNESKAITMLSQKNIVDVYDVCLDGDIMFIVMEYIDGITLKEYIDRKKILDWREATFFTKQILQAMSHAHERGIVHRDLKPHNIMLLKDGTIKVTDFGIARLSKFDTQTITDKAIGSVHYISPEQASGDRTDEKTDIYSVGVMLYEMLTGTLPFDADSPVSVALMQVQAQPALPRAINDKIPQGLEDITIKAMMKDPSQRYQSAAQMLEDIIKIEENPFATFGYLDHGAENTVVVDIENQGTSEIPVVTAADAEGEEVDEQESNFKNTWLPIIGGVGAAVALIIVIAIGIVFWPNITGAFKKEQVVVPNYIGQEFDAIPSDSETGIKVEIRSRELSEQAEGIVLNQDPVEGTKIDKGSTVYVVVSLGKETVELPNVVSMLSSEATKTLETNGIKYTIEKRFSDSVEDGRVISTDPEAYTEITSDTTVTVYVSMGAETKKVTVPDLSNLTEERARELLEKNNLVLGTVRNDYHDTVAAGLVISQYIEKGTEVSENTSVDVLISLGPKPVETTASEPTAPNDDDDDSGQDDNTAADTKPSNVTFNFEYDLSAYSESETVQLVIRAESADKRELWDETITVKMKDLESKNYIYTSAEKMLPINSVVTLYVNGTLVQTFTVDKSGTQQVSAGTNN